MPKTIQYNVESSFNDFPVAIRPAVNFGDIKTTDEIIVILRNGKL